MKILGAILAQPMQSCLSGVLNKSKLAAFLKITLRTHTRIGTLKVIGMIDVGVFETFVERYWTFILVPAGDVRLYHSPFLRDFWHLNVAMMTSNNALIPDPDKEDILASKPWDWPFLHLGLRMCGWGDQQVKYYLLGTPVIYWGGALSLIAFVLVFCVYLLRIQRKYVDMEPRKLVIFCHWSGHSHEGLKGNGNTSFMLARLHSLGGACIMVSHHSPSVGWSNSLD